MNNNNLKIPIKNLNSQNNIPKYAYKGDAAFDLLSSENTKINSFERKIIKCGFSIAIPNGYAGLIIPRSGLALKHGITVLNAPGLIDSGYRGEICVVLYNTNKSRDFNISIGDRIAQMMIIHFKHANLFECDYLEETSRLENGFGSSGIKS